MDKPIGYWLKHLDDLLESSMEQALSGTSRREWQLLNAAALGDTGPLPFEGVEEATAGLTAKGWLADGRLTDSGRAAHARIAEQVGGFRRQATEGVSPEEYQATVGVLRRMAANLDHWPGSPDGTGEAQVAKVVLP
ncbi:MarR family winged helix-turn-helix transcriptional regulator [Nonomuraea zeae]|uniref:MarR family winged helix-turn-helix transcriptional regulator n=1 Tax=Nonomuraea zeae TaxID=1642303 RepID=UPI00197F5BC0|nr:MarR family transcriptional regulator [Nonomuraea zeae]